MGAATPADGTPGAGEGTTTWCEILPLVRVDGQVLYLHPTAGEPAWWVPVAPGQHPSRVVSGALEQTLDGLFDPATAVVYSTSWRFSLQHQALVLTYLALLPPRQRRPAVPAGFAAAALDQPRPTGGPLGNAPGEIGVTDVLVHGLRHFALLRTTDPAIAASLAPDWHACLAALPTSPAGQLNRHPTSTATTQAPADAHRT
jgi:hypothetical protein